HVAWPATKGYVTQLAPAWANRHRAQAFPTWGWQSSCNCSPPTQSFDVTFVASAAIPWLGTPVSYVLGYPLAMHDMSVAHTTEVRQTWLRE
ncbi:hypothetical protein HaLaN_03139, partial [Haematococcus lacustris]